MTMQRRTRTWGLRAGVVIAAMVGGASSAAAIEAGQLDDFESGMAGWDWSFTTGNGPAGPSDMCLEVSGRVRLVTTNLSQWSGDYRRARVGAIRVAIQNASGNTLPIRIALSDGDVPQKDLNATWYSTQKVDVPSGGWGVYEFSLDPADLELVQGALTPEQVLADVERIRFVQAETPAAIGDFGSGPVRFDDIEAVSIPGAVPAVGGAGVAALAGALAAIGVRLAGRRRS